MLGWWKWMGIYRIRRGVSWTGCRDGRRIPGDGRLREWLCDRIGRPSTRSPNASWKRGRDGETAPWVLRESRCGCRANSRPAVIRTVRVVASGRWSTSGRIWRTIAASASPPAYERNTQRTWYPLRSGVTTSLTVEDSKQSSSTTTIAIQQQQISVLYIINVFSNSGHSKGLRLVSALTAKNNCSTDGEWAAGRKKRKTMTGKEREVERSREREVERERACANLQAIQWLRSRVEDWMETNGSGRFYSSGRGEVRALTGPQRHPSALMGPHGPGNRPVGGG